MQIFLEISINWLSYAQNTYTYSYIYGTQIWIITWPINNIFEWNQHYCYVFLNYVCSLRALGLQIQPKIWPTGWTFWINGYLELIVYNK